ncbi:efflux RND transporter permease subunit [bacterium]|nr:efflux RND transporter permease subunit [bacterium]
MGLSDFAVKKPIAILMLFIGVVIIGAAALMKLPVELMPNASFGNITIYVGVRGGMPPTEIENLVTRPIEEAVGTVSHLQSIQSTSKKDRSIVALIFEPGTDMDFAALEVREHFAKVKNKLPKEIEKPIIAKYEETDVPVMILALTSQKHTPEMLRKIVDQRLKEVISRVNGVANVDVGGGRERKILVDVNQARIQAYGLPIRKLISILELSNLNLLSGEVERTKDKYFVRTMGEFKNIQDIKNIGLMVTPSGSILRLKDVATVKDSYLDPDSIARLDARPTVSLYIQRETTANIVKVAESIEKAVEEFKKKLPRGINIKIVSNQAVFVKEAISTVKNSLLHGAILSTLILFLFLRDWRSTLSVILVIPISVMITFALMYFQKITLNIMTLSGLALGIGMLVDNSIVVLENIFKHREEVMRKMRLKFIRNKNNPIHNVGAGVPARPDGRPQRAAPTPEVTTATNGAREMVLAIIAATITTIVVFIPITFINKQVKILYSGLALTVTFSLLASLFVSLSLVPLLTSRIKIKLPGRKGQLFKIQFLHMLLYKIKSLLKRVFSFLPHNPKLFYRRAVGYGLRRRYIFILGVLILFGIALLLFTKLDKEFMGTAEQNEFTIFVELPSGTKLEISSQVVGEVEKRLKELPEIKDITKSVQSRIEGWSSKVYVKLAPKTERSRTVQDIIDFLRPELKDIGRVYDSFVYFSEPESSKEITLDIYGYDYKVLRDLANKIGGRIGGIPGLSDVKLRYRPGQPELRLKIDKQKAALFGFSVKDIAETIHAQVRGLRATRFHTESGEVETIARLDKKDRVTFDDLKKLTLVTRSGEQIYLEQMAEFDFGLAPSEIWRKDKSRMIQVSANRGKLALGKVVEMIKEKIGGMQFPKDYFYEFGGDYVQMVQSEKEFKFAIAIMVILVFMVLASLFESYWQPLIIMATVPLAAIGAVVALFITKTPVTMGVFIGMIMLGGIVVNNAIVLIDRINFLRRNKKGFISLVKSIIGAGQDRLRPIFMTTLTTVLGLFPMAMDKSEGSDLWSPLAITVIGGLLSSTILTLIIVPGFYMIFEDIKKKGARLLK